MVFTVLCEMLRNASTIIRRHVVRFYKMPSESKAKLRFRKDKTHIKRSNYRKCFQMLHIYSKGSLKGFIEIH